MICPNCGLANPDDAVKCNCGYSLTSHRFYRSYEHMRLTEFFSNSWRTFGANWTTFLILAAIPTIVSSTLALATGVEIGIVTAIITWIVSMIVWVLSTMALTMAAHKTSDGETVGFLESYDLSLGLFWRYIRTCILYFLIVLGGVFLLIIPGIIWGTRYFFATYAVIIEGTGGRAALSRSKTLIKGKTPSIFFLELGFGLLFFLVISIPTGLLILLVGVVVGNPLIGFSEPTPEWAGAIQLYGQIISQGLFVIFNVLLFKSLRALAIDEKALRKAENYEENEESQPDQI